MHTKLKRIDTRVKPSRDYRIKAGNVLHVYGRNFAAIGRLEHDSLKID